MRYVKYIGLSQMRVLTAADWRRAGLTGDTVVWNAFNGFAVPLDQFNEDQIRKAFEPDPNFVITGEGEDQEKEFEPQPQSRDMTPSELEQATENPVDLIALMEGAQPIGPTAVRAGAAPNGGNSEDNRQEILEDTPAEEEGSKAPRREDGTLAEPTKRSR